MPGIGADTAKGRDWSRKQCQEPAETLIVPEREAVEKAKGRAKGREICLLLPAVLAEIAESEEEAGRTQCKLRQFKQ